MDLFDPKGRGRTKGDKELRNEREKKKARRK